MNIIGELNSDWNGEMRKTMVPKMPKIKVEQKMLLVNEINSCIGTYHNN